MRKKDEMRTADHLPSRIAVSQEDREAYIINEAYDLAERQIREGTASSQTINHFLRMGSQRERAEMEMLRNKVTLLQEQTEALKAQKRTEEMYVKAINAMRRYSGAGGEDIDTLEDL